MLNKDIFKKNFPQCKDPGSWTTVLSRAMNIYEINTEKRISNFLAQIGYESGQFNVLVENLRYTTAARLFKVYPKRFPSINEAAEYVNNPDKLGNYVYANRLGNGDVASGDGFRFRGRGLIQLTGKSNYEKAGKELKLGLLDHPDLLSDPTNAAMSAAWFWHSRGLNELADDNTGDDDVEDFKTITKLVNGGLTGLDSRIQLYDAILNA